MQATLRQQPHFPFPPPAIRPHQPPATTLFRMRQFYDTYNGDEKVSALLTQPPPAQLARHLCYPSRPLEEVPLPITPVALADLFGELYASKEELITLFRRWRPEGAEVLDHVVSDKTTYSSFRLDLADALKARGWLAGRYADGLRDRLIADRPAQEDQIRRLFDGDLPVVPPPVGPPSGPPTGAGPGGTWFAADVFIAHASPDKVRATELYHALVRQGLRPFMDDKLVRDGAWDIVLRKELGAARLVAVLHSQSYAPAHYLRDEVALAVELHRQNPARHRLRVVYLDGYPKDPTDKPSGLGIINALVWAPGGADAVAAELARDLAGPPGAP